MGRSGGLRLRAAALIATDKASYCFCPPCSQRLLPSPSGQKDFFLAVGVPVKTRTSPPPKPDAAAQAELKKKVEALAPKYRTELLPHA
jgi:hypothetical protein